jgi:hypothetical protein
MILKFQDWNELNEANLFDKIGDWFQTTFGPSHNKLKKLLDEYKNLELKFVDEWEEVKIEIDKLELQKDQTKNDPAEQKKILRLVTRNKDYLASMGKAHEKNMDYIVKRVKKVIGEEQKLKNFWELNKSKVDAEVAQEMYDRSKQLSNKTLADNLYKSYREAVLIAKEKDQEFKEKYGNLNVNTWGDTVLNKNGNPIRKEEINQNPYIDMPLGDFNAMIQKMEKKEIKSLVSSLTALRNDLYYKMDYERDSLNSRIAKGEVNKNEAAIKLKDIREMYMDKIRSLRTKITVARRNA